MNMAGCKLPATNECKQKLHMQLIFNQWVAMSDYIYRAYWQFQKKKLVTSFFGVIIRADVCLVFPKIQFFYRTKMLKIVTLQWNSSSLTKAQGLYCINNSVSVFVLSCCWSVLLKCLISYWKLNIVAQNRTKSNSYRTTREVHVRVGFVSLKQ